MLSFVISFALIAVLFAAIYKVLPDKKIDWHDVTIGAIATSFLFTIGKSLIGLYIGSSSIASSYGAAGALAVLLLWIYYSAQIFLFGAEFTKVYAETHGSHAFVPPEAENDSRRPPPAESSRGSPSPPGSRPTRISQISQRLKSGKKPS